MEESNQVTTSVHRFLFATLGWHYARAEPDSLRAQSGQASGILNLSGGSGPAVALNQDGKLSSADSPAERGSIIVRYATGEGETNPSDVDGRLNEFDKIEDFPRPLLPAKVTIGGQDADVLFAAGAPGFLAGLMQLNVRVQAAANVPVVLSVGTVASPPVTVAVR